VKRGLAQRLRDLTARPMAALRNRLNYRECRCPQAFDHTHHLTRWWHWREGKTRRPRREVWPR